MEGRAVRRRVEVSGQPGWDLQFICKDDVVPTIVILSNGEALPCIDGNPMVIAPPPVSAGPSGAAPSQAQDWLGSEGVTRGAEAPSATPRPGSLVVGDVEEFFDCVFSFGPLRCPEHLRIREVHKAHRRGQRAAEEGDWGYVLRAAAREGCLECCQRIVEAGGRRLVLAGGEERVQRSCLG